MVGRILKEPPWFLPLVYTCCWIFSFGYVLLLSLSVMLDSLWPHRPGGASDKESACLCRRHDLQFQSLGLEDPLEEGMATHSSVLVWRIPWTEKPGRLQSIESQRVRHDWNDLAHTPTQTSACQASRFFTIEWVKPVNKGILLLQCVVNGLSSSKEKYLNGPDLVKLALKRNWAERL